MIAQLDADFVRSTRQRTLVRLASYFAFEGRPAAAPGQFVNPMVLAHLRSVARRPASGAVDRPVFVVGMGRSGTTVLGLLLGSHPSVGFLNEPKAMWHVICPDEDVIGTYSAVPGRLRLGASDADPGARQRAHALYAWYLRATRSSRVVDKYPELVFRAAFVQALFPDAHFVVVTRDPWSTISSVSEWSATHSDGEADWWGVHDRKWKTLWREAVEGDPANADVAALELGAEADQRARAAVEWIVTARAAGDLAMSGDSRMHPVAYEELTRHPAPEMGRLLEGLGLSAAPATLDYADKILRPARTCGRSPLPRGLDAIVESTRRQHCPAV